MAVFGFVVPVYKVKTEYLIQCVNSLRNQSFSDIQIILVDDCSPDECGAICDRLAEKDSRIVVAHHKNNKGLSETRNTGIELCTAEWISFVDSDDWVESNMCEALLDEILKSSADVYIYSGFENFESKENKCTYTYSHGRAFVTEKDKNDLEIQYMTDRTVTNLPGSFPLQSACIRVVSKKLFDKGLRFLNVKFSEDGIFHLYSTELAESVVYLHYNFYHYRCTEGSMTHGYRRNADQEQLGFLKEVHNFADRYSKPEEFKTAMNYIAFVSMQMCIWQKYFNPDNKESFLKRWKECNRLLKHEYYRNVLANVRFSKLVKNQKIKYIMIRLKMYGLLSIVRSIYSQIQGRATQH